MFTANLALALAMAIPAGAWTSTVHDASHDYGDSTINQKVFDDRIHQQIWATSASHFGVIATAPKGNVAVLSYPSRQDLEYLTPATKLKALRASYDFSVPKLGDYEAAFDIWVQPNGQRTNWDHDAELMIWTDNHGQRPAGQVVGHAVTQYAQSFTVWLDGSKGKGDSIVTLVQDHGTAKGTMHILSVFRWLWDHGYFPRGSALLDVEYGWEICSTAGVAESFTMNSYALHKEVSP
jgi:hypothetical protein